MVFRDPGGGSVNSRTAWTASRHIRPVDGSAPRHGPERELVGVDRRTRAVACPGPARGTKWHRSLADALLVPGAVARDDLILVGPLERRREIVRLEQRLPPRREGSSCPDSLSAASKPRGDGPQPWAVAGVSRSRSSIAWATVLTKVEAPVEGPGRRALVLRRRCFSFVRAGHAVITSMIGLDRAPARTPAPQARRRRIQRRLDDLGVAGRELPRGREA